jgi:hypothetical protein
MAIAIFAAGAPVSGNGLITEDALNDLVLAERSFELSMAEQVDLFDTPIITPVDLSGTGTLTARFRQLAMGWSISMDATAAEDTDGSASSVSATDADVVIARRHLRFDETGLARAVGSAWGFDPLALGMTMGNSFRKGRMGLLATAIASASTNITSSGTGSIDDLYDVIDSFMDAVGDPGLLFGIFKPFTLQSIRDSLRSEVGPQKERPDVQAFIAKGAEVLLGIACFPYTGVTSAASKYENAVMTAGAIGYGMAMPSAPPTNGVSIIPDGFPLRISFEGNDSRDVVELNANAYDGVVIREQARIRGLLGATS